MYHKTIRIALACAGALTIAYAQDSQPAKSSMRSSADHQFMMKAAQGGMAEVEMGQLAATNGSASCVKQFGNRMVTDHSKANDEAKQLASEKNITLPTTTSAKDQSTHTKLSSKNGAEFDKAYMSDMIKDHQTDINEFQHEASSGMDPDVKAWASKTLPTLQEHLRMAQSCGKQVGAASSTGGER